MRLPRSQTRIGLLCSAFVVSYGLGGCSSTDSLDPTGSGSAIRIECEDATDCDDNDLCTTDACNGESQCVNTPVDCDDDDACTDDWCDAATGDCVNTAITCDDGDLCTDDTCDPRTGCVYTDVACDDGDPCTDDWCDAATGACINTAMPCHDGEPDVPIVVGAVSVRLPADSPLRPETLSIVLSEDEEIPLAGGSIRSPEADEPLASYCLVDDSGNLIFEALNINDAIEISATSTALALALQCPFLDLRERELVKDAVALVEDLPELGYLADYIQQKVGAGALPHLRRERRHLHRLGRERAGGCNLHARRCRAGNHQATSTLGDGQQAAVGHGGPSRRAAFWDR